MNKFLSLLIIALATVLQAATLSDTCNQNTWVTNGPVNAIVPAGDKVYIGGIFTYVGPYTGGGIPIDTSTGAPVTSFPKINGTVNAVCTDGNGGWFVGGSFTSVGGVARNNIAHIFSNGSLDPAWNPNANYAVSALTISGSAVYTGGGFTFIGGQTRNHIAALDVTTGNALAWNPNAGQTIPNVNIVPPPVCNVYSLAVNGSTVYAGGWFDSIGGQSRNCIAALDATTGNALAWNPNPNALVRSLALSGTTVYAGGIFTSIGGQSRNYIAALDSATGNALAWNPNANSYGFVYSLAVSGTTVFAGGEFTSIGGQDRNRIAALDAATGNALAWDPNANYIVYSIVVSGTTVYAGGSFTSIGGQSRNYIAALDATTGNATTWDPTASGNPYGTVLSLGLSGTTVYAGGVFTSIGGQRRNNIAALNAATGKATDWNPNANFEITAIAVSGTTVFAGGDFDRIGEQTHLYFAALDATTAKNSLVWNPNAGGIPQSLAVSGTTIYAAGNGIAALDATTGDALPWNPNANGGVFSLALSGATVYVGGTFDTIGGQCRNHIAALDVATGKALTWNPDANALDVYDYSGVSSLAVSGTTIYAGGAFDSIGGQSRRYIAALDATTGKPTSWNPNPNALVRSLALSGTTVYAGGEFSGIGGQNRGCIAALDAATGNALTWNPNATNGNSQSVVYSLAVSGTTVYVGGYFNSIGQGVGHPYFAQFDNVSSSSPVTRPITLRSGLNNTGLQIIGSNFYSGAFVKFAYSLPKTEHVPLRLYSLNGQLQSELVNKHQNAGNYSLSMQRGTLATGAYLIVFKAGEYHQEKMISLMK